MIIYLPFWMTNLLTINCVSRPDHVLVMFWKYLKSHFLENMIKYWTNQIRGRPSCWGWTWRSLAWCPSAPGACRWREMWTLWPRSPKFRGSVIWGGEQTNNKQTNKPFRRRRCYNSSWPCQIHWCVWSVLRTPSPSRSLSRPAPRRLLRRKHSALL